jgi:hypothetical protein
MSILLADYHEETDSFLELLESECERRILIFHGESGTGKTTLFRACQSRIPDHVHHLPIQLRGHAVGVDEIFSRAGGLVGWESWPGFTERVVDMTPHIEIEDNFLRGINNRISVALHAESPVDRKQRRVDLTEAWFSDTRDLDQPLLMMLDTYEEATEDVADWISGPFLARSVDCENLRVVIAGQEVPDEHNIEWGNCCNRYELYGVREAKYWLPVIEALGLEIPAENPLDYMAGICHAFDGRPDEIMKCIGGFPTKQTGKVL